MGKRDLGVLGWSDLHFDPSPVRALQVAVFGLLALLVEAHTADRRTCTEVQGTTQLGEILPVALLLTLEPVALLDVLAGSQEALKRSRCVEIGAGVHTGAPVRKTLPDGLYGLWSGFP